MGYNTDFTGEFKLNRKLNKKVKTLINGISQTRRMKRDVEKLAKRLKISKEKCIEKYGPNSEFYFDPKDIDNLGQTNTEDIIDYNTPPGRQPSLWCQWCYDENSKSICWDGGEKFYDYIEWIRYIVEYIIKPQKIYKLNGVVNWYGEEDDDKGTITIKDNEISIKNL